MEGRAPHTGTYAKLLPLSDSAACHVCVVQLVSYCLPPTLQCSHTSYETTDTWPSYTHQVEGGVGHLHAGRSQSPHDISLTHLRHRGSSCRMHIFRTAWADASSPPDCIPSCRHTWHRLFCACLRQHGSLLCSASALTFAAAPALPGATSTTEMVRGVVSVVQR